MQVSFSTISDPRTRLLEINRDVGALAPYVGKKGMRIEERAAQDASGQQGFLLRRDDF